MSDDEGRLIIDDPNSPDNGGLIIADDSPRKGYLNMLKELEPSGVTIGGSSRKKVYDPDLTPPYMNGKMNHRNEESIEDGEIAEDDELTPEEQMKQMMANQQSSYRTPSTVKSPNRSSRDSRDGRESRESRESRDGRDGRESRNNGSNGDGHISRSGSSHAHSHSSSHQYPHSRGAPGGVRSKPDPLSAPHSHTPAGHLRKSIDHERERERKDRHHSIHSLHSSVSSSTAASTGGSTSYTPSSVTIPSSIPSSSSIVPLMALDVPTAVPSPALTEIIERGERREDRKRDMKENGDRRERNSSVSSSTSSNHKEKEDEKREVTPSLNGLSDNRRKRESILSTISEEKDGIEPPEKKRKQKDENKEDEEELEEDNEGKNKSPSPPSFSSRGTSVGIQAERDEAMLNLPAGSSITLTFTVVCRSEQANNDLNNTLYLSTMIGGREMMCVLTDSEILGMRRRSLASSSSSDDSGNRNGTPSKSFRGGNGTPRDKRARNGMERKRRVMAENDEEDSSHDSCGGGEGTSNSGLNLQRIELVEKAPKREMHYCTAENCEFRFSRSSELEYHKEEMHRKKKTMREDLACQTDVSSFLPRSTIQCQTDTVIVMTKEEDEERRKTSKKTVKVEPKVEEDERIKENGAPALTIHTGAGPSSSSSPTPSSTGATVVGGTLLMKASPSNGGEKDNVPTHIIHHPKAIAPPSISSSSSSSMPTLLPATSTPSTPSSSSKPPRLPAGGGIPSSVPSISSPLMMTTPLTPQSIMMGGVVAPPVNNPHPPGTHAHTIYQQHLLTMHPAYAVMQQTQAAIASQHKQPGGTTTQHKINELKVKQEETGPSTSGIAAHPSMVKVSTSSAAPTMQSPAANNQRQQQQQQQMHPQFGVYPVMVAPPTPAQQQQMMFQHAAAQQFNMQSMQSMQQFMMSHLMNGTTPRVQPQPQNMQMTPEQQQQQQMMLMQQMMMMQQPQHK